MLRLLIAIPFLIMSACTPRLLRPASLFGENASFHQDSEDKNIWIYHHPDLKVTSYSKFLIDPVKIYSDEKNAGMNPAEEKKIARLFQDELIKMLQPVYPIVDQPGPDVLRIQAAIVDIEPAHLELDENKFLVVRLDTSLRRAVMELNCIDGSNGERVAALIHLLHGNRYAGMNKKERLLNIQEAFQAWTQSLLYRFNRAKQRPEASFDGLTPEDHRKLRFQEGE